MPAIVTAADLELVPVFAEEAVTVIVPLFVPDTGDTLSQLPLSVILQLVFDVMLNVPPDPEAKPSEILVGETPRYGTPAYVQYMEYLLSAKSAAPNVAGMPPAHEAVDCALAGVPAVYLVPTKFSNTHESHIVCPEVTDTGLPSDTVCQPAAALTTVDGVTPRSADGVPEASE